MFRILGSIAVAAVLLVPGALAVVDLDDLTAGRVVLERRYDTNGELVFERGIEAGGLDVGYVMHFLRLGALDEGAKPGGGGGGSNDCAATAYKANGYYWNTAYSAYASDYASIISGTLNEWDASTGASISGGVSSGVRGEAGVYDGVNQMAWVNLGASSTIAVTTTWYYRGSGVAVESDAEYNTYYPWSTNGDANSMDVENIAQHETGHTYGLGHPSGKGAECLTMYAYADYGETQKRTLGTGDILGIQAIYGN